MTPQTAAALRALSDKLKRAKVNSGGLVEMPHDFGMYDLEAVRAAVLTQEGAGIKFSVPEIPDNSTAPAEPRAAEGAGTKEVTIGSVMIGAARGDIPPGPLPPAMVAGLERHLNRITREGIAKVRAEQDRLAWPLDSRFSVRDTPGEHGPCYLVCPDGAMIELKHYAENGVDQARAQWIADACNAALFPTAAAAVPAGGDAVAWQVRRIGGCGQWGSSVHTGNEYPKNPGDLEYRPLYLHPAARTE